MTKTSQMLVVASADLLSIFASLFSAALNLLQTSAAGTLSLHQVIDLSTATEKKEQFNIVGRPEPERLARVDGKSLEDGLPQQLAC